MLSHGSLDQHFLGEVAGFAVLQFAVALESVRVVVLILVETAGVVVVMIAPLPRLETSPIHLLGLNYHPSRWQ